jgi:hypothetical protein
VSCQGVSPVRLNRCEATVKNMTTNPIRREPELLGQTVVVIGGSAGIGLETARRARDTAAFDATYDIDGGQQLLPA